MKTKFVPMKNRIPVTVCDGRPPFAADLIGFEYYLGKKGGALQIWAKVESVSFGKETIEKWNVHSNW